MVIAQININEEPKTLDEIEIIRSDNWELPVCNLGKGKYEWRPKTAFLPYYLFEGPAMTRRTHGINLAIDLSIGVHGPRGSTKTLTLSYLLAKKLRMGQTVWNNWPISFYVVEPECWDNCETHVCHLCSKGKLSYYESFPLNMDKVYTFNSELSDGAVGFTEFQYYVEARTSGREQNRFLSYQIMQIRKSALSFTYDVQNESWVDKRFGWSDDGKIYCKDVSKMNYKYPRDIEEGEFSHWKIRDISGVLTGVEYQESGIEYGPYQFDGYHFWHIFPTKWKVDVYDAVWSMKQRSGKADQEALLGQAMELAINSFVDEKHLEVIAEDMWARASALGKMNVSPVIGGKILSSYGIPKSQNSKGKYVYDLSVIIEDENK